MHKEKASAQASTVCVEPLFASSYVIQPEPSTPAYQGKVFGHLWGVDGTKGQELHAKHQQPVHQEAPSCTAQHSTPARFIKHLHTVACAFISGICTPGPVTILHTVRYRLEGPACNAGQSVRHTLSHRKAVDASASFQEATDTCTVPRASRR